MNRDIRNTLLISAEDLKNTTLISGNTDEKFLNYTIQNAQELYLIEITGEHLLRRMQEIVFNTVMAPDGGDTLAENPEWDEMLEFYIKPFLGARGTLDALFNLSVKFKNATMAKLSDTNVTPITLTEIQELSRQYQTYVDGYAEKLSAYLCENQGFYKDYLDKKSTVGAKYANSDGLWLGKHRKSNCSCK